MDGMYLSPSASFQSSTPSSHPHLPVLPPDAEGAYWGGADPAGDGGRAAAHLTRHHQLGAGGEENV